LWTRIRRAPTATPCPYTTLFRSLRSDELAQHEIAYYFAMLALGLLGGLEAAPAPLSLLFMALVVAAIAVVDHPALLRGHQKCRIDRKSTRLHSSHVSVS